VASLAPSASSWAAARFASRSSRMTLLRRVLGLDQDTCRVGLPPGALLRPEQVMRRLRPVLGGLRAARGQRAIGRHQQQLGLVGGGAAEKFQVAKGAVRLGQRVAASPAPAGRRTGR